MDTLNDLKSRDIDNLEDLLKSKGRLITGTSREYVQDRLAEAMRQNLLAFGFDIRKHAHEMNISGNEAGGRAEDELARLRIKIEHRTYDKEADRWRSGLYIYRDGEIIFFSNVVVDEPKLRLRLFGRQRVYHGRFWSRVPILMRG